MRIRRAVLPPNHPDLALGLQNLADVLVDRQKLPEAEDYLRQSVEILKPTKADPLGLITGEGNLGMSLRDQGKLVQAEEVFREENTERTWNWNADKR